MRLLLVFYFLPEHLNQGSLNSSPHKHWCCFSIFTFLLGSDKKVMKYKNYTHYKIKLKSIDLEE